MLGHSICTQSDSVTRWIFFEGLHILHVITAFRVCADDFQVLAKDFPLTVLFASLKLLFLQILKILTETFLRISFSVMGRC